MQATKLIAISILIIGTWIQGLAQGIITPSQALAAARAFANNPSMEATVTSLEDDGESSAFGLHYLINRVVPREQYLVDAHTAVVFFAMMKPAGGGSPVDKEQAESIARQYVAAHFPFFVSQEWVMYEPSADRDEEFLFQMERPIPPAGAISPYHVSVEVLKANGAVALYSIPRDVTIRCNPTPAISLAQAKTIATQFATLDIVQYPLNFNRLEIEQDPIGAHHLVWNIAQRPGPVEDPGFEYRMRIDAVTGDFLGYDMPLGFTPKKPLRKPTPRPGIIVSTPVRSLDGKNSFFVDGRDITRGGAMVRVEYLRTFGARVRQDAKTVTIRGTAATLEKPTFAIYKDNDWWVPLRTTAKALGWKLTWDAKAKLVTIDSGPDQQQAFKRTSAPRAATK